MSVVELKAQARRDAMVRRAEAHAAHRESASDALTRALGSLREQVISGYLPIRTEADPLPAMKALAGANRICVPVIQGPGQPLVFKEWRPGCALEEGPFRVMVPRDGDWLVPKVLIVPLLAFDPRFHRLGYGGGFYDRTLESLRAAGPIRAVGFAYGAQRVEALPPEPTDQPLDEVVTEAGAVPLAPRR
ncbi:5-formyltetrahydrofolate cyclo-ligase [Tropicimonas aquimaris]|uniref:5-formyltetrahydrofolate cyclo-ligase n=1 Tax=Tropicimonas aquimaris TaxID=914152 RepID=A0ABW3IQB7_9RHOB